MTFETSKRINKWVEEHEKECQTHATVGEQYMCRNQCAEDDEFKITPEEAEKLMKSFMHQATSITIKPCPYLLPCGFCDKRDGELCSQFFRT